MGKYEFTTPKDIELTITELDERKNTTSSLDARTSTSDPIPLEDVKRSSFWGETLRLDKKIKKKLRLSPEEREIKKEEKKKRKEEKDKIREEQRKEVEENEFKRTLPVRLWMIFIWIGSSAIMIWFTYQIAEQYAMSVQNPSSKISVLSNSVLPLPSAIVCNWNQEVGVPYGSCSQCQLTLVSCTNLSISTLNLPGNPDCSYLWTPIQFNTTIGLFYCYQFNNDLNSLIFSVSTGYSGSLATIWGVTSYPPTNPPTNRAAVQVTFNIQNITTPQDIVNEISFAPTGYDVFFGLQYINTIHSELDPSNPNYNTSYYETTNSMVKLLYSNSTLDYIGISFSFQTLSIQQILFSIDYTLLNFFGDFSGMVGTLMGLDVIKFSMAIPTTYFAWKFRACWPLEDVFNG